MTYLSSTSRSRERGSVIGNGVIIRVWGVPRSWPGGKETPLAQEVAYK